MNRLDSNQRTTIIAALVEGTSIRAIERMTGFTKRAITKLLIDAGVACAEYQDRAFRNLGCRRIQCDEIWSFCYAKNKNVPAHKKAEFGVGSVWTWTAIDADTKLVPCWVLGDRSAETASMFISDLADRLRHRVQLTTDGYKVYVDAVEAEFGSQIDYAMLIKLFGDENPSNNQSAHRRYSPAECTGTRIVEISGSPDLKHVSTSYVERQNLTMRMHMRTFTRLTNAFSKKIENHAAAIALHFMYYNFVKTHQTLRMNPCDGGWRSPNFMDRG